MHGATPTPPPLRVLLTERSPLVREGGRQMLAEIDGVVVAGEAATCAELRARLQEEPADVILLDLSLPCPDLANAIAAYRCLCPGVTVLALSQFDSAALAKFCHKAGADAIFCKTTGVDRLTQTLCRLTRRPRSISPCATNPL